MLHYLIFLVLAASIQAMQQPAPVDQRAILNAQRQAMGQIDDQLRVMDPNISQHVQTALAVRHNGGCAIYHEDPERCTCCSENLCLWFACIPCMTILSRRGIHAKFFGLRISPGMDDARYL